MAQKKSPTRPRKSDRTVQRKRRAPATARVSVSLEKDVLARAERFAREQKTTVPALIAAGLRKLIGYAKSPVLPPGDLVAQPAEPAGAGWDQMLAWMEDQQATLTQIRDAIGEVAASLPVDSPPGSPRPDHGTRIPPL